MPRPIKEIARDIQRDWRPVYFGAVPYLAAMHSLDNVNQDYGYDSARSVLTYFLSNASHWRGPVAKHIKDELRDILGIRPKPNGQKRKTTPDSWKAEILPEGGTKYVANSIRFATQEEARAYAKDLHARWAGWHKWRARKSAQPVNAKWDGHLVVTD